MLRSITLVLAASASIGSAVLASSIPQCRLISSEVSATAANFVLPAGFNLTSILDPSVFANFTKNLPTKKISGTYKIVGRYCEPVASVTSRKSTLQVLIHGATYTKNYWSGLGAPGANFNGSAYSWVEYASKLGYPTYSIDRLCNGDSDHPDGLAVCQEPMGAAVVNGIIELARSAKLVQGRTFSKIIVASHSLGSLTSNALSVLYPNAVDSYILTGFTNLLAVGAGNVFVQCGFTPAPLADGFKNITDPSYFVLAKESGIRDVFYYGDYNPQAAHYDYLHRGTATIGEVASAGFGQSVAPQFTKSVMVLNGLEDVIFCARPTINPLKPFYGDCGNGSTSFSSQTRTLYPNAKVFKWANVAQTGHDMNLHYNAQQQTFKIAHEFWASQGF